MSSSIPPHHPDSHILNDWPIYGPKDVRIADLVWELAYGHGLRVAEIEGYLIQALEDRLNQFDLKGGQGEHL